MLCAILSGLLAAAGVGPAVADEVRPPIPVRFTLEKAANVTLVIEDGRGNRVRNLVMDQPFGKGGNVAWWDGLDDHGQAHIRQHGGYDVTGRLVSPGRYTVRGIAHDPIDLIWQFCPYLPNNPIRTKNRQGQWLSDHTPPCSLAWIGGPTNEIAVGATLAEGAHAIMWLTGEGRKIEGRTHIGATYMGPAKLSVPKGPDTLSDYVAYGLGVNAESLVVVGLTRGRAAVPLFSDRGHVYPMPPGGYFSNYDRRKSWFSLAVYGRTAVVSWPSLGCVRVLDLGNGEKNAAKVVRSFEVADPRGVAFDDTGALYLAAGREIRRFAAFGTGEACTGWRAFKPFAEGLDEPRDVLVEGNRLFVSLQGRTHQVWELALDGRAVRTFGKKGAPTCGPYDELKMQHPQGLMLTPGNELWVAEEDFHPKRLSVWDATPVRPSDARPAGAFKRALYGPVQYGGGGKIDPRDPTRFYCYGMEMKLDWEKGEEKIVTVFARSDGKDGEDLPADPVYVNGRQYMCNTFDAKPIDGPDVERIYRYDPDGVVRLLAMVGQLTPRHVPAFFASSLTNRLTREQFVGAHHYSVHADRPWGGVHSVFAWSDLNEDGVMQDAEVTIAEGKAAGVNRLRDSLDLVLGDGKLLRVVRFTETGVPVYDVTRAETLGAGRAGPQVQVVPGANGGYARLGTWASDVAAAYGIDAGKWAGGAVSGQTPDGRNWFYPYCWRGLHASQLYPNRPPRPGELIGGTKLIGPPMSIGPDALEVFALNANSGQIYLMTVDGFFVAALFRHGWHSAPWGNAVLKRGDNLNDRTSDGEGFRQTITRTPDGKVYVQALNHTSSIVEVKGLESVRRLPSFTVEVTPGQLEAAKSLEAAREAARQERDGRKRLGVVVGSGMTLDGCPDDWGDAEFVLLDFETEAALKIARNGAGKPCLYAALKTRHANVLANSGADPWVNMFKTGGAFDVQLETDVKSDASAKRLLLSEVGGRLRAILYEPKSMRTGSPGAVSSPSRTVRFDFIGDVSKEVGFAKGRLTDGKYRVTNAETVESVRDFRWSGGLLEFCEFEIPLDLLGWRPEAGVEYRGDIGFLLGDGSSVRRRTYWNNKATSQLYDAPDESLLHPKLWGRFKVLKPAPPGAARNVQVMRTRTGGAWRISSAAADAGKPCCSLTWAADGGELPQRAVGTRGFVCFRHDSADWVSSDTRAHVLPPFAMDVARFSRPGRAGDGLLHGSAERRLQPLVIDGQPRKNGFRVGAGGELGASWTGLVSAEWPISLADTAPHRITCVFPKGADRTRLCLLQDGKKETLYAMTARDAAHALVVQFDVTGSFSLVLEQDPYEKGHDFRTDGRSGCAAIQAIFLD